MGFVAEYIMGWNTAAVVCLIIGILFMVYEIFTPGLGLSALLGGAFLLAAVILRADSLTTALITIIIIAVPLLIAAGIVMHSFSNGVLSRSPIVLNDSINTSSAPLSEAEMSDLIGASGIALTPLRPAGNADFGGRRLDVVSEGGFIAKGAGIMIVGIDGVKIKVREV